MRKKSLEIFFTVLTLILGILSALVISEVSLYLLVKTHNLHLLPTNLADSIYYNTRSVIQFEPDFAEYDKEVSYLLKKNARFTFANYEFPPTGYLVNRMGTRDTEEALIAPEIIFVGDSYTMGWGVNQAEAFPQMVSALTGKRTLNTGIAGFGTAREMLLLKRLITKETKQIVIQYCSNDFEENKKYINEGFSLKIMSEKEYRELSNKSRSYPGYLCKILFSHFLENVKVATKKPLPNPSDNKNLVAHNFLRILAHHRDLLIGRQISIIISPADKLLVEAINKELHAVIELQGIRFEIIDTSELIQPGDSYPLDKHYKPSGHRKIASLLTETLTKKQPTIK